MRTWSISWWRVLLCVGVCLAVQAGMVALGYSWWVSYGAGWVAGICCPSVVRRV